MPSWPRRLLVAVAAASLCAAQSPSAWAEFSPVGGVQANEVRGQGKLVSYDSGPTLHVFSSTTRRWHHVDKSPGATVQLFNDCALLTDGNRLVAISSYHGENAQLFVSPNATLWNGANAKNDSIVLVEDNGKLHAFSAFTGTWVTRPLAATASGSVQRHVAVVHSGNQLWGMGAFDGRWHDLPANNITSLDTDGTAGFALGGHIHAFSAHTRTWRRHAAMPNAALTRGDDWGIWADGSGGVAFSGLTGTFTTFALPAPNVAAQSDLFALVESAGSLHAYSAVTGDLAPLGTMPAAIDVGLGTALLRDAGSVRGYSALRQQVQPLQITAGNAGAGSSCAFAMDSQSRTFAFSAITGSWQAAPAATVGRAPLLTTTTVALESANDCFAFDANSAQFVPLGHAVQGVVGNTSSAPLLAYDGAQLHAYDGDRARWISTPRTSNGTPTFRVWRTTALVVDGDSAHGVGAQAGRWHTLDLGPHNASAFANSEVGFLVEPQRIAACGMLAEIVSLQQFPHFRRVQPRGAEIVFSTTPIRDAMVIAGFSPPGPPTMLPGLGELHLDLAAAFLVTPQQQTTNGVARVAWSMPPAPALAGATVFAQLLMIPGSVVVNGGLPYLGDRSTVHLW